MYHHDTPRQAQRALEVVGRYCGHIELWLTLWQSRHVLLQHVSHDTAVVAYEQYVEQPATGWGMSVGRSLHEASNMAVAQAMSNTDVQCVFFMTECLILCQRLYSLILPRTFRSVLSSPQAAKISSPRLARMVV